jgi:hypothetical protein
LSIAGVAGRAGIRRKGTGWRLNSTKVNFSQHESDFINVQMSCAEQAHISALPASGWSKSKT